MGQLFFKYRKIMPEEAPRGAASGVSFCLFYLSNALNLDRSRIYMSFNSANHIRYIFIHCIFIITISIITFRAENSVDDERCIGILTALLTIEIGRVESFEFHFITFIILHLLGKRI